MFVASVGSTFGPHARWNSLWSNIKCKHQPICIQIEKLLRFLSLGARFFSSWKLHSSPSTAVLSSRFAYSPNSSSEKNEHNINGNFHDPFITFLLCRIFNFLRAPASTRMRDGEQQAAAKELFAHLNAEILDWLESKTTSRCNRWHLFNGIAPIILVYFYGFIFYSKYVLSSANSSVSSAIMQNGINILTTCTRTSKQAALHQKKLDSAHI